MLAEVMRSINNHFIHDSESGDFTVDNGQLTVKNNYIVGQYILLSGSFLNDGVYRVEDFADGVITISESSNDIWGETFNGTVYSLKVPREFITLVDRIKAFTKTKEGQASNIVSANFGIQGMSFATNDNGAIMGWQDVFSRELSKYRRMFSDLIL